MAFFDVLAVLFFALPAYISNAVPVAVGGKTPLDFGLKFLDGRRVWGKGKTWRGTFFGVLVGWGTAIGVSKLLGLNPLPNYEYLSLLIASGAVLGDLTASFLKRRMGLEPGEEAPLVDQLDFLIGAFVVAWPVYRLQIPEMAFLVIVTPLVHRASNILAYKLSLKSVPW